MLSQEIIETIKGFQKNEITEYHIYTELAAAVKDPVNSKILEDIGKDEYRHYNFWKNLSGTDVKPDRWKILKFSLIARLFGLTFGIKLMEKGEKGAEAAYEKVFSAVPDAKSVHDDEEEHERKLMDMIQEERLQYVGSVVLGLNDALVELTGTLAGLTFALQDNQLIALAGLITGIAASFSMAASEYLSTKAESDHSKALKSSVYTGTAYVITVFFLILPFFAVANSFVSLALTLAIAILVIFFFNYYISVAKDLDFKSRFLEMAAISLGVAAVTFVIGRVAGYFLGVEV